MKTGLIRPTLSRWQPIKEKMACVIFSKYCINNSRNCTIFSAQEDLGCPFDLLYFDLGVTSCDLSMTFTVLKKNGRKWTLTPKLAVGVGMV